VVLRRASDADARSRPGRSQRYRRRGLRRNAGQGALLARALPRQQLGKRRGRPRPERFGLEERP
jgi:hypothetical protein